MKASVGFYRKLVVFLCMVFLSCCQLSKICNGACNGDNEKVVLFIAFGVLCTLFLHIIDVLCTLFCDMDHTDNKESLHMELHNQ